jgi:hypothetical protein
MVERMTNEGICDGLIDIPIKMTYEHIVKIQL